MFEESEVQLDIRLEKFISRTCPDYIIEVGCYDGDRLNRFGSHSPYSRLVGFEANPTNFFNLCLGKNIQHLAICDRIGSTILYESTLNANNVRMNVRNKKTSSIHKRLDSQEFIEYVVPCNTLDNYFKLEIERDKKFVLLIDAEGATADILKGAKNFLKNTIALKIEAEYKEIWKDQKLIDEYPGLLENMFLLGKQEFKGNNAQTNLYYIGNKFKRVHFIQY